jgi:hypothetical protein
MPVDVSRGEAHATTNRLSGLEHMHFLGLGLVLVDKRKDCLVGVETADEQRVAHRDEHALNAVSHRAAPVKSLCKRAPCRLTPWVQ